MFFGGEEEREIEVNLNIGVGIIGNEYSAHMPSASFFA